MRGLGVLVAVAVSGFVGAWITKLVIGAVSAPLFFFGADDAPTRTVHRKSVLIAGGLLQALLAALLLVVLKPSTSGYRIDLRPAVGAVALGVRGDADRRHGRRLGALDHRRDAHPRARGVPADARSRHARLRAARCRRQ